MKLIFALLLLVICLVSCKKDKLEDNYSILQGKWKWVSSKKSVKHSSYVTQTTWYTYDTILASSISNDYFLEFEKKGTLAVWKDEREIKFFRINTHDSECSSGPINACSHLDLYLNFKSEKKFSAQMNEDTMYVYCNELQLPLSDYPKEHWYDPVTYRHTFVRIN